MMHEFEERPDFPRGDFDLSGTIDDGVDDAYDGIELVPGSDADDVGQEGASDLYEVEIVPSPHYAEPPTYDRWEFAVTSEPMTFGEADAAEMSDSPRDDNDQPGETEAEDDDGPLTVNDVVETHRTIAHTLESLTGRSPFQEPDPSGRPTSDKVVSHEVPLREDELPTAARDLLRGIPVEDNTRMVSFAVRLEAGGSTADQVAAVQFVRREDRPEARRLLEVGVRYEPGVVAAAGMLLPSCGRAVEGYDQRYRALQRGRSASDGKMVTSNVIGQASGSEVREIARMLRARFSGSTEE